MITAFKGFQPGLICLGYQFAMGKNVTEKANCRANGFQCAENPSKPIINMLLVVSDSSNEPDYLLELENVGLSCAFVSRNGSSIVCLKAHAQLLYANTKRELAETYSALRRRQIEDCWRNHASHTCEY